MKDVLIVACCCIVSVIVFGYVYESLVPKHQKVSYVPCSIDIVNMAKKINVTLMSECEVVR